MGPGSNQSAELTSVTNCTSSDQCGSGFQCVNGECVQVDQLGNSTGASGDQCGTQTGGDSSPGAGGGGCGGGSVGGGQVDRCTTASPGDCTNQPPVLPGGVSSSGGSGCGNTGGGGVGGSSDGQRNECDAFCEAWESSFGDRLGGCQPPCPDCESCTVWGECYQDDFSCRCSENGRVGDCAKCGSDGEWINYSCDPPPPPPPKNICHWNGDCGPCEACDSVGTDVAGKCIKFGCERGLCKEVIGVSNWRGCANWQTLDETGFGRACVSCGGGTSVNRGVGCNGGSFSTEDSSPRCGLGNSCGRYCSNGNCGCCAPEGGVNCYVGNFRVKGWDVWHLGDYHRITSTGSLKIKPIQCPEGVSCD